MFGGRVSQANCEMTDVAAAPGAVVGQPSRFTAEENNLVMFTVAGAARTV